MRVITFFDIDMTITPNCELSTVHCNFNPTPQQIEIYEAIFPILRKKGLKSTTMDNIAAALQISKRTLYEMYENKEKLIEDTLVYFNHLRLKTVIHYFNTCETAIEALYQSVLYHTKLVSETCPEFFRDMDNHAKKFRAVYENNNAQFRASFKEAIAIGIEQGVFRADVDYDIAIQLFTIQLESLKRMEDQFPPEITMKQVQEAIGINFLRAIATIKGIEILDKYMK